MVAQQARIPLRIVQDLLDGAIWPDLAVIARLEKATEVTLWGGEHFANVRHRTIKKMKQEEHRPNTWR